MIDSIFVGMSGLSAYSQGLRVIANNVANLNTPGFKGASMQFADMFYSGTASQGQLGHGLSTAGTHLNFAPGELRPTGNALDLAIDGNGMFVLRSADGTLRYSRAGQFEFDADGLLVNRGDGSAVMGTTTRGRAAEFRLDEFRVNDARPTASVRLRGNLSSSAADHTLNDVRVIDAAGGEHLLTLQFANNSSTSAGQWTVTVLDGTTTLGSGTLQFSDGRLGAAATKVNLSYTPSGQSAIPLSFDFTNDTTSFAAGSQSTLAVIDQDGHTSGTLTGASFDAQGYVVFAYSNGQTARGNRLQLARFESEDGIAATGDNAFEAADDTAWQTGAAGGAGFGTVRSGVIEISNVNLSREFGELVIMQRGYQASSQVVSTANEMLQQLFQMVGK